MQQEKNKIKQSIIPEFSSGSSTLAVTQQTQPAWKTLKQVQGLSNFNFPLIRTSSTFPLDGEGVETCRSDVSPTNQRNNSFYNVGLTPDLHLCSRRAFTLIELLVVVLIIGILAAIALPQYQLAVARTRLKGMIPLIKAVFIANQVYYLANGSYTNDITALDLSLPNVKEIKDISLTRKQITFTNGSYLLIQGESDYTSVPFVSGHVPNIPAYLHRFYDPTQNWRCYATKERGTGICKAFGCEGDVPVNKGGCALPTIK